jgi:hypothetical protein
MRKRRSFARRRLTAVFIQFLGDNKLPIAMLTGLYLVSVAIGKVLGGHGYWQGFSNGFELAALIASFLLLFLMHTGALNQIAGAYGESRTQDELEKARRRGSVWGAVHNVELPDGDIDSIVFAPGGVLAIETKWQMRSLDRHWLERDVAQAQRGADKTRLVLRSKNVDVGVHDVTPLLVIWGKASADVAEGGENVRGVHVLDGNELQSWLTRVADGPLSQTTATLACNALTRFAEQRAV